MGNWEQLVAKFLCSFFCLLSAPGGYQGQGDGGRPHTALTRRAPDSLSGHGRGAFTDSGSEKRVSCAVQNRLMLITVHSQKSKFAMNGTLFLDHRRKKGFLLAAAFMEERGEGYSMWNRTFPGVSQCCTPYALFQNDFTVLTRPDVFRDR